MSKHTPGPWSMDRGSKSIHISGGNWFCFAKVYVTVGGKEDKEGMANARLIAAAPDLLDALEKAVAEMEGLPHSLGYEFTHLREMRAVLAKLEVKP